MQENHLKKPSEKLWSRGFVFILVYAVFCQLTMSVTNTVLPLYVVNGLGMSAAQSGLLGTMFTIGSCVCRFLAGSICDRAGYRRVMIIGALMVGCVLFFLGLSSAFVLIILLKLIQGVGHSLNTTASNAAAGDNIPRSRFGDGMGYYGLTSTLSNAIGPTLSLALMGAAGFGIFAAVNGQNYRLPLMLGGILGIAAAALAVFVRGGHAGAQKSAGKKKIRWTDFIETRALKPAFLQLAQGFIIGAAVYMILYANARGYRTVSVYYIVSSVMTLLTRLLIGKRMDTGRPVLFATVSNVALSAGYLLLGFCDNEFFFIVMAVISGATGAVLTPLFNSLALKSSPKHRGGAASSTYWLGFDVGIAIGQVVFGALIDTGDGASFTLAFIVAGILMVVYTVVTYFCLSKTPPLSKISSPE